MMTKSLTWLRLRVLEGVAAMARVQNRLLRDVARVWLLLLASLTLSVGAHAQLVIDVNKGVFQKTQIVVLDFEGEDPASEQLGRDLAAVVRTNLLSTGLFTHVDPAAYIEREVGVDREPRFGDWRLINVKVLVTGRAKRVPADPVAGRPEQIEVVFRMWDILAQSQMLAKPYGDWGDNWRSTAHRVSDDIYTRLTGEDGYFDTKIVFVAEDGPKTARRKRLALMDQDGANPKFLTKGDDLVLTPRFSPREPLLTYMSYSTGKPQVYLFDINSGRQESLGSFDGMTMAPRFTPDGNGLLYSLSQRGNADLYVMDRRTRVKTRLTEHPSIDVSPSMSPDGRQIVFTSDRSGTPQLYVMNTDRSPLACPSGGRDVACRITFAEGRYSTPVWSPRGDFIAFTRQTKGEFGIGVIRPDGEGERILSTSYQEEGPGWSPNGRVVVFFRDGPRGPQLYAVDLTGQNLRPLRTPGFASDPAWSPLVTKLLSQ
jgi:TolB protein